MNVRQRIAALRSLMKQQRLQAYLIPSTDPHQSEYVPALWRRREWISGFTGSAGDVVVTLRKAALWTDGRYFLQAAAQLAGSGVLLIKVGLPGTPNIVQWLSRQLRKGSRVGVDPRVLSIMQYRQLKGDLNDFGIELVSVERNLVDALWADRPQMPLGKIEIHPVRFAGESANAKLRRIRKVLHETGAKAHVVAALDSLAWLFNIRGDDVQYNPVVIGYAVVTEKRALLFTDRRKVTREVRRALGGKVVIRDYGAFGRALVQLARSGGPVLLDPSCTSEWIVALLRRKAKLIFKESPITRMKAAKNAVEIRGARRAHVRDGAAMVRFFVWLDEALGREKVTEIRIAEKLRELRSRSRLFRGESFDTIVGYAGHGAIIHYSATPETDVRIRRRGILIVDSGGQYPDGTTDITRTICLGAPTRQQKEEFTRVVKGHLQVALASFPAGTFGRQLDTLARKSLWEAGLDYQHGTGHGVGSYLGVHEGPQSISPARDPGVALVPGMICSNEPGYYKTGEYGFRVENLVYVTQDKELSTPARTFLKLENLTLCPIETKLIAVKLLTPEERRYFNAYHAKVRKALIPLLGKKEAAWLRKATRPI